MLRSRARRGAARRTAPARGLGPDRGFAPAPSGAQRRGTGRSQGRSWPALLLIVGAAGSAAADEESYPRGEVAVEGWAVPETGQSGGTTRARIDLDEDLSIHGFYNRALTDAARDGGFGYGQVTWGSWRIGGGVVGDDAGVHLGYAPHGLLELHDRVDLKGELDVALGAGFLGEDLVRRDPEAKTADLYPDPIDLYAGSLATRVELEARPLDPLTLTLGIQAAVTAVVAPPGDREAPDVFATVAEYVDLGLSNSLSQAAGGAYGGVGLRLARWGDRAGGGGSLHLRYLEAWDWIHLDPVYSYLYYAGELEELELEGIPPRQVRSLELSLALRGEARDFLIVGVEGRHTHDSTTMLEFADRNGWSVGARIEGRYGRVYGEVSGRYHLSEAEIEDYLGELARYQVRARLGAYLIDTRPFALRVETGVSLTLADRLGLPRDATAVSAGLAMAFGGARRTLPDVPEAFAEPFAWSRTPPFGPPRGEGATGGAEVGAAPGDEGSPPGSGGATADGSVAAAAAPPPEPDRLTFPELQRLAERLPLPDHVDALVERRLADPDAAEELPTREEVVGWLDRRPQAVAQVDERLPGVEDLVRDVLEAGPGGPDPLALLTSEELGLVAGYGREGMLLSLLGAVDEGAGQRARLHAVTARLEGENAYDFASTGRVAPRAYDFAVTTRTDPEDTDAGEDLLRFAAHRDLLELSRAERLEKVTLVLEREGRREPVFQAGTSWTRAMHFLLTGRAR